MPSSLPPAATAGQAKRAPSNGEAVARVKSEQCSAVRRKFSSGLRQPFFPTGSSNSARRGHEPGFAPGEDALTWRIIENSQREFLVYTEKAAEHCSEHERIAFSGRIRHSRFLVRMKILPIFLGLIFMMVQSAYSWDGDTHRAIAEAARGMLTADARTRIAKILGNDDLAAVSVWLDDVRQAKRNSGPLKGDPEAKDFNAKFPKNNEWHYVNLPVGSTEYAENSPFASKNDVVHALSHSIDVLEGKSDDMTKLQALRVLVHLVGDIHQPLHTVSGYFDLTDLANPKLITDAKAAVGKPHDRGGNQLYYGKTVELHHRWDKLMPRRVQRTLRTETLAAIIARGQAIEPTPGDYHSWPAKWAGDSAKEAIELYGGITFGQATMKPDGGIERIEITMPDLYDRNQTARAQTQLVKAAAHLAQLINNFGIR
jgi:hypothetical protein